MNQIEIVELTDHNEPIWWVRVFYPMPSHNKTEGDVFWSKDDALSYFEKLKAKHEPA